MANLSFLEEGEDRTISLDIRTTYKVYILIRSGNLTVDDYTVSNGDFLESTQLIETIRIESPGKSELLIFAGEPISDPAYHYGPFVMDSAEGLERAFMEYENGKFGKI